MNSLILTYLAYAIGTGEYGYIGIFSIFYMFLMSSLIYANEVKKLTRKEVYE
jgi:hypothetical protein